MTDKNMKYYFGWYRSTGGNIYCVRWIEDEGIPIGSETFDIVQVKEITADQFNNLYLSTLELMYPYNPENKEEKPK